MFTGKKAKQPKSFRFRIVSAFGCVIIVPLIFMQILSYQNTINIVKTNASQMAQENLMQTKENITLLLSTYEDLLFQLYTSDDIVELINTKAQTGDRATYRYSLRKMLRGIANIKDYIQSIAVITVDGEMVFYDKLTASNQISWMDSFDKKAEDFLKENLHNPSTKIYASQYAADSSMKSYYLFHMAHRIVDYTNITKELGVVVISIDERVLYNACNHEINLQEKSETNVNFIMDEFGELVTFPETDEIGKKQLDIHQPREKLENDCIELVKQNTEDNSNHDFVAQILNDPDTGWRYVNVSDQSDLTDKIKEQLNITLLVSFVSVAVLIFLILVISKHLTGSIHRVETAIQAAGMGDLSVQVEKDRSMPREMVHIADEFNKMTAKINHLIERIKTASLQQKNAEIAMLEAQINPHFLYNTLDTINWMAIDNEEYEISNAISVLGEILRYGVDRSNSIVSVQQEIGWLEQYLFLQQTRMKNQFSYEIKASPNVMNFKIHKLLFQPFIENAILHAFKGERRAWKVEVVIKRLDNGTLRVTIEDNGCGMDKETLKKIEQSDFQEPIKNNIGISNAVGRLKLYYDKNCTFQIESKIKQGTKITIEIFSREVREDENSDSRR